MLLYFNGDSYSAGDELADDMLPDYPGCHPQTPNLHMSPEYKQRQEWIINSRKKNHPYNKVRMSMMQELTRTELARSYPSLVHKMTGIPFINKSIGGSSIDRIARVTISDLINLKKDDPDRKLVAFICTTYVERSEVPNNLPPSLDIHGDPQDWVSLSHTFRKDDRDQAIESIKKYKGLFEYRYHSMVNFYKNIVLLQDYCKLNDIDLYWVTARADILSPVEDRYKNRKDLTALMDYANIQPAISMKDIVDNELVGQHVICPGGHFAQPVHAKTAEKIVAILKEQRVI